MDALQYMRRISERYKEPYIQIPTSLIRELTESLRQNGAEAYSHYGFSFLIANGFLYKYAHYVDFEREDYMTLTDLKELLKYSPNNQKINKVSKKGGILESESYVEVTTDIPISVNYETVEGRKYSMRRIHRLSDVDELIWENLHYNILRSPNYSAYIPEFMIDYNHRIGTLNNYDNTFKITYKEFDYFLSKDDLTMRDFLFYCYIKSMRNKDRESCFSYDTARKQTGLSHMTVKKSADVLSEHKLITVIDGQNINRFRKKPKTYIAEYDA